MTEATLDASYPSVIQAAHAIGQLRLHDPRTRDWLYRRLPQAIVRSRRMVVFPAPWADAGELLAEQQARLGRCFQPDPRVWPDEVKLCEQRVEASRRAIVAGHARGEGVIYWDRLEMPADLASVLDWLNALEEDGPRLLDKLLRVTWDQAVEKARIWHERLAKMRSTGIAGDDGTANRIEAWGPGVSGWSWCQLVTKGALDREGAAMGHCVGSKSYEHYAWKPGLQGPPWGVWSLRDESGRSRVTAEVVPIIDGYAVAQAFGPENARPDPETAPAFGALAEWFVPPDREFRLPNWLVRTEGGSTRLLEASDASDDDSWARMHVPYGEVLFRPMGAGNFIGLGDVDEITVTQRVRYSSRRPRAPRIEVVTTQLDTQVEMRPMNEEALQALRDVMLGGRTWDDLVAEQNAERAQSEHGRIEYRAAPVRATEPRRRGNQRHYAGEPTYRQIERRFSGRPS